MPETASPQAPGSVVTVGTFDGVHRGHRRLIEVAADDARRLGLTLVAVTFDRHPSAVVRPEATPKLLTSLEHKVELLASTGVDDIVVLAFDRARANESAEDFVVGTLVGELFAREILVGSNFRFGHRQRGDVRLLEQIGPEFNFMGAGIELIADEETHTVVSSSRIRGLIENGVLDEAERLLGRPHEVRGVLDGGDVLLLEDQLCLPPPGRYEVEIGRVRPASVGIGRFEARAIASGLEAGLLGDGFGPGGQGAPHLRAIATLGGGEGTERLAIGLRFEGEVPGPEGQLLRCCFRAPPT